MKKIFLLLSLLPFTIYSAIKIDEIDTVFVIPKITYTDDVKKNNDNQMMNDSIFHFSLNNFEGEVSLAGYWNIIIGFGAVLSYNPELSYIADIDGIAEGFLLDQKRLLYLDIKSDSGLSFSLYAPDDINKTEFELKYEQNKFFRSFYVTNKIPSYQINPYRTLTKSRATDITTGLQWGNNTYRGRFDIKFDSTKSVTDKFSGNKRVYEGTFKIDSFMKAQYFYLPDRNINSGVSIYCSVDEDEVQTETIHVIDGRKYKLLKESSDYLLYKESGRVVFYESVEKADILINYFVTAHNSIIECGDAGIGVNGIFNQTDCNINYTPELFVSYGGRRYLKLYTIGEFSPFEEKNSYTISSPGKSLSDSNFYITDYNGNKINGYRFTYDETMGALRVTKSDITADIDNIYPFYSVFGSELYKSANPSLITPAFVISYTYKSESDTFRLSETPIAGTVIIRLNSIITDKITVNYNTGELVLKESLLSSDIIEVTYLTNEDNDLFLTFSEGNTFKLSKNLFLYDSTYFKMPVKLWETSYYNSPHHAELMYNIGFKGSYPELLTDKSGAFEFSTDATASLYIPELKNITLLEDFEREKTGKTLTLDYRYYLPVDIPMAVFPELSKAEYGKIYYRNAYTDGVTGSTLLSIYDNLPGVEPYEEGGAIGPYSTIDGYSVADENVFTKKKNSQSLISEIELQPYEAVSIAVPLYDADVNYKAFSTLKMLMETIELSGQLCVFIDAGKISEQYLGNTQVRKEYSDEGLEYHYLPKNITLLKGKNDGINSTNDMDSNGLITADNINYISRLIPENGEATDDFLSINKPELKMYSFKILSPEKLDGALGLRLTFFNPSDSSAKAKILINQLRLAETGMYQEEGKRTKCEEIFPAEDNFLLNHIFSKENSDRDNTLHFTRDSERTLKISVSKNDPSFYLGKIFQQPVNIGLYKQLGFYILKQNENDLNMELLLRSTDDDEYTIKLDTDTLKSGKWGTVVIDIDKITGGRSGIYISDMRINIINNQLQDDIFYMDEFYLENINVTLGGALKTGIYYKDPKMALVTNGIPIFSSPEFIFETTLLSDNFTEKELSPIDDSMLRLNSGFSFNILSVLFSVKEKNSIGIYDSGLYSENETTVLKISRGGSENVPVSFEISYDYADTKGERIYDYEKNFYSSVKYATKVFSFENGMKVNTIQSSDISTSSEYFINSSIKTTQFVLSAVSKIKSDVDDIFSYGSFSCEHLVSIISNDLPLFYYKSNNKTDQVTLNGTLKILDYISYVVSVGEYSKTSLTSNEDYYLQVDKIDISHGLNFHFIQPAGEIIKFKYNRILSDSNEIKLSDNTWEKHFDIKHTSYTNNFTSLFIPPFQGRFLNDPINVTDIFTADFILKQFVKIKYFIPEIFNFTMKYIFLNKNTFTESNYYGFSVKGKFEQRITKFYIDSGYTFSGSITKENNKQDTKYNIDYYHYLTVNSGDSFDSTSGAEYSVTYNEFSNYKNVAHKFVLSQSANGTFYKYNELNGNYSGPEAGITIENTTIVYQNILNAKDFTQKPVGLSITPSGGYRFNKNIGVTTQLKLAYYLEYSNITNLYKHDFGVLMTITGKVNF